MAVYKDNSTGKWRVIYRFTDWTGKSRQTQKRGFLTKKEAVEWEREQMRISQKKLDMTFASFVDIYRKDRKPRLKENTWNTKEVTIQTKILPYFKDRKMDEIEPRDVIEWQNQMMNLKDKNGKKLSPVTLKTIHAQLSAIFNHAVRYYHLPNNPAARAGSIPYGKLTIIQGDPGDGKTTLVLNLAARLSRGEGMEPEMEVAEPVNIIYQTAEDGLADTVKPRLEQAGADCTRISVIDESDKALSMVDERLEQAVVRQKAKVLILDPIQA